MLEIARKRIELAQIKEDKVLAEMGILQMQDDDDRRSRITDDSREQLADRLELLGLRVNDKEAVQIEQRTARPQQFHNSQIGDSAAPGTHKLDQEQHQISFDTRMTTGVLPNFGLMADDSTARGRSQGFFQPRPSPQTEVTRRGPGIQKIEDLRAASCMEAQPPPAELQLLQLPMSQRAASVPALPRPVHMTPFSTFSPSQPFSVAPPAPFEQAAYGQPSMAPFGASRPPAPETPQPPCTWCGDPLLDNDATITPCGQRVHTEVCFPQHVPECIFCAEAGRNKPDVDRVTTPPDWIGAKQATTGLGGDPLKNSIRQKKQASEGV